MEHMHEPPIITKEPFKAAEVHSERTKHRVAFWSCPENDNCGTKAAHCEFCGVRWGTDPAIWGPPKKA
jgi:hypothetical protein